MKKLNKITATLSIAASVLLQSCSDSSDSAASTVVLESNTKAPELSASWSSDCTVTSNGSSTTTGSSGSSSGVSGGTGFITKATFNTDGSAELSTQYYASSACNPNATIRFDKFNTSYFIGNSGTANDGSAVTNFRFVSTSTTYTIFQIINATSLYIGDFGTSTTGNDGSSEAKRLDGLGVELNRL